MAPKETLIELYIDKKLTSYAIAKMFNCDRTTIIRWLKAYKIEINHN